MEIADSDMKKLIKAGAVTDLQTLTALFEKAQNSIQNEERMNVLKHEYKSNYEAFMRSEDTSNRMKPLWLR